MASLTPEIVGDLPLELDGAFAHFIIASLNNTLSLELSGSHQCHASSRLKIIGTSNQKQPKTRLKNCLTVRSGTPS
jgi:hypothetical protein